MSSYLSASHIPNSALPLPTVGQIFTGQLTYYDPGLGACGISSSNTEMVVSLPHAVFDASAVGANPNNNPLCGRTLRATRTDERTGKLASVDLKVVDRCECLTLWFFICFLMFVQGVGCAATDIDVSPSAFQVVANPALGRVNVQWAFL